MTVNEVTSPRSTEGSPPTVGTVSKALENFQAIRSRALRRMLRFLPWAMLLAAIIVYRDSESGPGRVMWSSGMTAAALAVFGFQVLMRRIPETFHALWSRSAIQAKLERPTDTVQNSTATSADPALPEERYRIFIEATNRLLNDPRQRVWGTVIGLLAVGWITWPYLRSGGWELLVRAFTYYPGLIGQIIVEPSIGYIFGLLSWRMLVVGYQVWQLGKKFDLTPQLGHPDQCGGLEPIGNLCLWNALIISVAGVFLGSWIIAGPSLPEPYRRLAEFWTPIFSALLFMPVVIAAISFFLPLWSTHQVMVAKRASIQRQLDQLGQSINHLAWELLNQADKLDPVESEKMTRKLERMRQIYQENKHIPVWPFNIRILSKFTTSQIIPLLGLTGLGQPIVKAIAGLFDFLTQAQ